MTTISWIRDRPVAVKVQSTVLLSVTALIVVGGYGVISLRAVDVRATALYRHAVRPAQYLADRRDMEGDARTSLRDYLLATTPQERVDLRQAISETDAQLDGDTAAYLRGGGRQLGTRRTLTTTFQQRYADFRRVRDEDVLPGDSVSAGAPITEIARTIAGVATAAASTTTSATDNHRAAAALSAVSTELTAVVDRFTTV